MPRDVISKHGHEIEFRKGGHAFVISISEKRLGLVDLPYKIRVKDLILIKRWVKHGAMAFTANG